MPRQANSCVLLCRIMDTVYRRQTLIVGSSNFLNLQPSMDLDRLPGIHQQLKTFHWTDLKLRCLRQERKSFLERIFLSIAEKRNPLNEEREKRFSRQHYSISPILPYETLRNRVAPVTVIASRNDKQSLRTLWVSCSLVFANNK
ncbi:MAG: hypothetical protein IJH68_06820 [Thermoguttaceae bacterium]|nr:hypothetical protein [Thermoguttaceae bacterium]